MTHAYLLISSPSQTVGVSDHFDMLLADSHLWDHWSLFVVEWGLLYGNAEEQKKQPARSLKLLQFAEKGGIYIDEQDPFLSKSLLNFWVSLPHCSILSCDRFRAILEESQTCLTL